MTLSFSSNIQFRYFCEINFKLASKGRKGDDWLTLLKSPETGLSQQDWESRRIYPMIAINADQCKTINFPKTSWDYFLGNLIVQFLGVNFVDDNWCGDVKVGCAWTGFALYSWNLLSPAHLWLRISLSPRCSLQGSPQWLPLEAPITPLLQRRSQAGYGPASGAHPWLVPRERGKKDNNRSVCSLLRRMKRGQRSG